MKKLIFVLIICVLTNGLYAQEDPVKKVFNKYAGEEGFTTINIRGCMLKMLAKMDPQNEDLQAFSNLDEIKILAQEDKTAGNKDLDLYNEIYNQLDKTLYKELLVVNEKDERVNMLVRENDGIISEFLMIVSGDDENVLINIKGEIELSKLAELTGPINIKYNEKLKMAEN